MTSKPQPKVEVAIKNSFKKHLTIDFFSTPDALIDFEDFGIIQKSPGTKHQYTLFVDSRYDFDEILAYIGNYDKGGTK